MNETAATTDCQYLTPDGECTTRATWNVRNGSGVGAPVTRTCDDHLLPTLACTDDANVEAIPQPPATDGPDLLESADDGPYPQWVQDALLPLRTFTDAWEDHPVAGMLADFAQRLHDTAQNLCGVSVLAAGMNLAVDDAGRIYRMPVAQVTSFDQDSMRIVVASVAEQR